jgi:hypothetical protein
LLSNRTLTGVISFSSIILPGAKSVELAHTVIVLSEAELIRNADINEVMMRISPSK